MTLNFHWRGLTPSQRHSAYALVGIVVGVALDNSALIEAQFPAVKWLGTAFILAGAVKAALSRGLDTKNSGTNTGLIDSGPDTRAAPIASDAPQGTSGPNTGGL